jgi:hypothetical protein
MNKAFFINGGAGRVLCSIPALEEYAKTHEDFIVVAEAWGDFYSCSKILRDKVYPINHKNLFEFLLKDKEIVSPEPYRLNAYFNQKCNLIQAFDILINDLDHIPETKKINLELNKQEQINGYNLVGEVKEVLKKNKIVIFQPFGSSAKVEGKFIYDVTGRSFELSDIYKVIEELKKHYGVILMTQIPIPDWDKLGVACPQNVPLNQWGGIINAADYFLGCDSMGQHISYALNKPSTVVIGSTYPENISYPNNKNFHIIDNGKEKRKYSPIRISFEDQYDRHNEDLMILSPERIKEISKTIRDKIGISKVNNETLKLSDATKNKSNQNQLPINPSVMPGFQKPKNDNKKKTIDKILELNDIKS